MRKRKTDGYNIYQRQYIASVTAHLSSIPPLPSTPQSPRPSLRRCAGNQTNDVFGIKNGDWMLFVYLKFAYVATW
jgi:hypothetical protein